MAYQLASIFLVYKLRMNKNDPAKFKCLSFVLILVIFICFLFELPHIEAGLLLPVNGDALSMLGANFGPRTISEKEYWRLITYGFLHSNILHLLLNSYAIWGFGPMAETAMGRKTFFFIYLFSGIVGGLASILSDPLRTSVGASASICGVLGAFIFISWFKRERDESTVKLGHKELSLLMVFLLYSLFLGFTSNFVDNAAHIGGFLAGVLSAALLTIKHKSQANALRANNAFVVLLLSICPILGAIDAQRLNNNPVVDEYLLRQEGAKLAMKEELMQAIGKFDEALKVIPDEPFALQGRGEALMKLERFEEAKKDFDTILAKDPKHKGALFDRSLALNYLGRYQEGLADVDSLVKIDPNQSMVYNNRAWFRLNDFNNSESLKAAMTDVEKSIKLNKNNHASYDTRGMIYLMLGDYDKATADFDKCSKIEDTSGAANFHLALIAKVKGDDSVAKQRMADYRAGDYKPDVFELKFCSEKLNLTDLAKEGKP